MSTEARCQYCNKPKNEHDARWIGPSLLYLCDVLKEFTPVVTPEPPFKIGDWVTGNDKARDGFNWGWARIAQLVTAVISDEWISTTESGRSNVGWFRLATPEEIRAVTHFTPKSGMLLREEATQNHYRVGYQAGTSQLWHLASFNTPCPERMIAGPLAHADWTILPSYEIKGVTL